MSDFGQWFVCLLLFVCRRGAIVCLFVCGGGWQPYSMQCATLCCIRHSMDRRRQVLGNVPIGGGGRWRRPRCPGAPVRGTLMPTWAWLRARMRACGGGDGEGAEIAVFRADRLAGFLDARDDDALRPDWFTATLAKVSGCVAARHWRYAYHAIDRWACRTRTWTKASGSTHSSARSSSRRTPTRSRTTRLVFALPSFPVRAEPTACALRRTPRARPPRAPFSHAERSM